MADIKVRVGAQNAIKVLSSASGGAALFADTATNVIGGIASVTQLDVSGISTLQSLRVSDTLRVTGISTFVGVATFNSNLYAAGNVTIGGTLQVGDTIFGTDIDTRNLRSSGITTLAANGGITTTGGDLYVGGDLYIEDDVVLDEVVLRNINVTGISTLGIASAATLNVVGISTFNTVNVTGVSTLGGNVSFGSSAIFADSKKILVGNDSDLEIFHSGTDSYITNVGTGGLKLAGTGNISIENSTLGTNSAVFNTGGGIDLYWAGAGDGKRLEILGLGVTVTGDLYVSGDLFTGGEGKIGEDITTRNLDVTGISTLRGDLSVAGIATFNEDVKFIGNSSNARWDHSTSDLILFDDTRLEFGSNKDFEIWHGGAHTYMKNSGGDLRIRGDKILLKREDGSETYLEANVNNEVKLFFNGVEKVATTVHGIDVTGHVDTDTVYVSGLSTFVGDAQFDGNVSIAGTLTKEDVTNIDSVGIVTAGKGLRVTTGGIVVTAGVSTFSAAIEAEDDVTVDGELYVASNIRHKGDTDTYIEFTGDQIRIIAGGKPLIHAEEGTPSDTVIINDGGNDLDFRVEGIDDEYQIFSDGLTNRVGIGSAIPQAKLDVNGTLNVAGVTTHQQDVYFPGAAYNIQWDQATSKFKFDDSAQLVFGSASGGDMKLFHQSGNSTIRNETGQFRIAGNDIRLQTQNHSEDYLLAVDGGSVSLFYNDVKRLETSSSGVDITDTLHVAGVATVTGTLTAGLIDGGTY